MFALHGNVRDPVALRRGGATEYCALNRFLRAALFGQRDLILY
jgi:hypothetical protein